MSDDVISDFEVAATGGQKFSSAAFRGHPYVLYFYPKDATPGCTIEGAAFRDLHDEFKRAGYMVFGVSRDTISSHEKFKAKMHFPFDLLADTEVTMCKLFDVIKEKNMYGKKVMGIERSTFVMGPKNEVLKAWRGVKVEGHAEAVLNAVKSMS